MVRRPFTIPVARTSAAALLLAALALLATPLAAEWAHAAHQAGAGHGECDAWRVSADHGRHSDDQFEVAERARHEHHGLCQGSAPTGGAILQDSGAPALEAARAAVVSKTFGPSTSAASTPPSRGPPLGV